jgi:hypothetical protein
MRKQSEQWFAQLGKDRWNLLIDFRRGSDLIQMLFGGGWLAGTGLVWKIRKLLPCTCL